MYCNTLLSLQNHPSSIFLSAFGRMALSDGPESKNVSFSDTWNNYSSSMVDMYAMLAECLQLKIYQTFNLSIVVFFVIGHIPINNTTFIQSNR